MRFIYFKKLTVKKFILTLNLLIATFLFAENYNYFYFNRNSFDVDYFTGNSFYNLDSFYILKNCEKIKKVDVHVKEPFESYNVELTYNKEGFIISNISDLHDGHSWSYEYNKNGYFVRCNDTISYKYLSENKREQLLNGKFQYRETIERSGQDLTVYTEQINPRTNAIHISEKSIYKYADEKTPRHFENISYDRWDKIDYIFAYDFEYNSEKQLDKITIKGNDQKKEKIRNVIVLEYDANGNIYKITNNNLLHSDETTITILLNYDEYGNWRHLKSYRNGKLHEETIRKITYR